MNTNEYLDYAKQKRGIRSDSQLANALGWSRAKISNYRAGKQHMDNEAARIFAEFTELPVLQVLADMEAQRQKDSRKRKAWAKLAKLAKQSGGATANLLFPLAFIASVVQVYILCKIGDEKKRLLWNVSIYTV